MRAFQWVFCFNVCYQKREKLEEKKPEDDEDLLKLLPQSFSLRSKQTNGNEGKQNQFSQNIKIFGPMIEIVEQSNSMMQEEQSSFTASLERLSVQCKVKQIALGEWHMMVLDESLQVYGYGQNYWGQLGINPTIAASVQKLTLIEHPSFKKQDYEIRQIECGSNHTIVLLQDVERKKPSLVQSFGNEQDLESNQKAANEEEVDLVIQKMYQGNLYQFETQVSFIRAKFGRSCVVTTENDVCIWGEGFGSFTYYKEPYLAFKGKGKIVDLQFGKQHLLYINEEGQLFSLGEGTYGETGQKVNKFEKQKLMRSSTQSSLKRGLEPQQVKYFQKRQNQIKQVACGSRHSLVLDKQGYAYAFGDNTHGQCIGNEKMIGIPKRVSLEFLVSSISAGRYHSVATEGRKKRVFQWGGQSQLHPSKHIEDIEILSSSSASYVTSGELNTVAVIDINNGH